MTTPHLHSGTLSVNRTRDALAHDLRGRIPRGLIGMLGLLVAAELWVYRVEDRSFTTNAALSWAYGGRAARRKAPDADVLCFGDSMIKFGVVPRLLEDRLGKRAFNLALYAGSPTASYFLLRRALESGAKPSAVLVDFQPSALSLPPRFHIRLWPELLSIRECLDLAWTARDADLFATLMAARLLPTVKDRHEVRANVMAALRGESYSNIVRDWFAPAPRNWRQNNGGELAPKNPKYLGNVDSESWLYPDQFRCDPVTATYVRRFLNMAAQHRLPVYWLMPPISPEAQARCDRSGLTDAFTRFARNVQARLPNVVVIDGRHAGYAHTVFHSPPHLDRQGASTFSIELAGILSRDLSSGHASARWVGLPAFRDHPIGVPLEDYNESQLALSKLRAARR